MALTKYNYNSFNVTPVASKAMGFNSGANGLTTVTEGDIVLIKTETASSDSTLSFVDGTSDVVLDDTYPTYLFKFINIHPSAEAQFTFQGNVAGGSGYNETITSTAFQAYHTEDDTSAASTGYSTDNDQAQGTSFQIISSVGGTQNDASLSGELWLLNPSSTTFVTHFMARTIEMYEDSAPGAIELHTAGYFNLTGAIDEIQFKMSSGNIDAGQIKLYGIKDS
jgi:hypothetical protein